MTEEVCIVATFGREELLLLSLEAIRKAAPDLTVKVFPDRGSCTRDVLRICREFNCSVHPRPFHRKFGNSYNLLSAMQSVLIIDNPQIVHLVEDDTIVHPDYFLWARNKLRSDGSDYAAAYAHCSDTDTRTKWYESPCASWDADHLKKALSAVPDGYFAETREEMKKVLRAAFPKSKAARSGAGEQDTFFLCCIEAFDWKTVHPKRPLATHLGFWGYNRPPGVSGPTGSFPERVEACRKFLTDKAARGVHFGERITTLELEGMPQ